MGLEQALVEPLLNRLVDRLWPPRRPLRSQPIGGMGFSAYDCNFMVNLENVTAKPVLIDRFLLRAFGPRHSHYQPVELEILTSNSPTIDVGYGLRNGAVPAYAGVVLGLGHAWVRERILEAKKMELVAISEGQIAWRFRTDTKWMRRALFAADAQRAANGRGESGAARGAS